MKAALRRWAYRGSHRAKRHSRLVADIKAELAQEPHSTFGNWEVLGDGTLRTTGYVRFAFPLPEGATAGFLTLSPPAGAAAFPVFPADDLAGAAPQIQEA